MHPFKFRAVLLPALVLFAFACATLPQTDPDRGPATYNNIDDVAARLAVDRRQVYIFDKKGAL